MIWTAKNAVTWFHTVFRQTKTNWPMKIYIFGLPMPENSNAQQQISQLYRSFLPERSVGKKKQVCCVSVVNLSVSIVGYHNSKLGPIELCIKPLKMKSLKLPLATQPHKTHSGGMGDNGSRGLVSMGPWFIKLKFCPQALCILSQQKWHTMFPCGPEWPDF